MSAPSLSQPGLTLLACLGLPPSLHTFAGHLLAEAYTKPLTASTAAVAAATTAMAATVAAAVANSRIATATAILHRLNMLGGMIRS